MALAHLGTSHRALGTEETVERFCPRGVQAFFIGRFTSSAEYTMSRNTEEATNSYVTDMLALKELIATAVKGQQEDLKGEHPMFSAVLRDIEATAMRHANALNTLADQRPII